MQRHGPDGWREELGVELATAGQVDEAISVLREELARDPESHVLAYRLASCLAYRGHFAEANELFCRDIPIGTGNGGETNTKIIRFPGEGDTCAAPIRFSELPFSRRIAIDRFRRDEMRCLDLVYFVSFDPSYVKLFAAPVAGSVEANAGARTGLHFHLINPDRDAFAIARSLMDSVRIPVAISHETVSLCRMPVDSRKTYYASSRFVLLPEILDLYDRPILLADADQLVVRGLSDLVSATADFDAALLFSAEEVINFFGLFSASAMLIRPTSHGGALAAQMRRYLIDQMIRLGDELPWHLDQVAIAVSALRAPNLRWYAIPPNVLQSDVGGANPEHFIRPEAVFWSITLSHPSSRYKLSSDLFRKYTGAAPAV
jgi:hypothetical protein